MVRSLSLKIVGARANLLGKVKIMDKKILVGLAVAAVLMVVALLWGPDVVKMVRDAVPEKAPVVAEEEPAPTSQPTGE